MTRPIAPDWLTAVVGSVSEAEPIRWGFTNESWAVAIAGGRRLAVTRLADPGSAPRLLARGPVIAASLLAAGIHSPVPIAALSDPGRSVISSELIDGASGMESMDDEAGAGLVGRVLGQAWSALDSVDVSGLGLDDLWARPDDLAATALRHLDTVGGSLGGDAARRAREALVNLPQLLEGAATGFVHGDLVPANVLLAGGRLAALLDLETIRVGVRLLDAAWFRWIVRYHHPVLEPPAWAAFVAASGLDGDDRAVNEVLTILPVVRILEILADSELGAASRAHWQAQLRAATNAAGAGVTKR